MINESENVTESINDKDRGIHNNDYINNDINNVSKVKKNLDYDYNFGQSINISTSSGVVGDKTNNNEANNDANMDINTNNVNNQPTIVTEVAEENIEDKVIVRKTIREIKQNFKEKDSKVKKSRSNSTPPIEL